ncbi:MAG: hypothetical protein WCJ84_03785 [Candidatus Peregrinibacteria bacterium]
MSYSSSSVLYAQDELMPSTKIVRNFGTLMREMKSGVRKRVVVLNNNEFQAVLLPIRQYENLKIMEEMMEDYLDEQEIQDRLQTPLSAYIPYEEVKIKLQKRDV